MQQYFQHVHFLQKKALIFQQLFAKLVGKQSLNITNEVDPSLLGGIRVQIGNHIYDSSVANKLERLKRELIG